MPPKPNDDVLDRLSIHALENIASARRLRQQSCGSEPKAWLEYEIATSNNKVLAVTELDSDIWVGEVKRVRDKKQPLTAAGVHGLRAEYTRTIDPARALAAETLNLERTLSDLVNQAYALTPAELG